MSEHFRHSDMGVEVAGPTNDIRSASAMGGTGPAAPPRCLAGTGASTRTDSTHEVIRMDHGVNRIDNRVTDPPIALPRLPLPRRSVRRGARDKRDRDMTELNIATRIATDKLARCASRFFDIPGQHPSARSPIPLA